MNQTSENPRVDDFLISMRPSRGDIINNILLSPPNFQNPAPPFPERSKLLNASGQYLGSLSGIVEEELFVTTMNESPENLGNYYSTGIMQIKIVSNELKNIIQSFEPERSEFFPVNVCYPLRKPNDPEIWETAILPKKYCLWHCYNWIDLIDDNKSEWRKDQGRFTYRDHQRRDLPEAPIQTIRFWGSTGYTPERRLVLSEIDYERYPFFRIVGMPSEPFISPAVADAIFEAGMTSFQGDVIIGPTPLDTLTEHDPDQGPRQLRIWGSDRIFASRDSPPLRAPHKA